jgi:hypothetical protein
VRIVNVEQLTAALSEHDAAPDAVLTALRAKQRRGIRQRGLLIAGAAVAVGAVLVITLRPWASATPSVSAPPDAANGCAVVSLAETLAMARQGGASVIIATGTLTGRTAQDTEIYYQMTLSSVRTLSGPPLTGNTAWVGSGRGPAGPIPSADAGALWGNDGRLFAIAWPARQSGTTVGPVLRIAPIVGDQVIFSSAGCWDTTDLPSQAYHGGLAEIPGTESYTRAATSGFHAVPLTTVEQLTH